MDSPASLPPPPDDPEHDPVWKLLDRGRPITPSASFAQTVTAAIHAAAAPAPATPPDRFSRGSSLPKIAWAAAALFLGMGTLTWLSLNQPRTPAQPVARNAPTHPVVIPAALDDEGVVQSIAAEIAMLDTADRLLDPQDNLDLVESDLDGVLF